MNKKAEEVKKKKIAENPLTFAQKEREYLAKSELKRKVEDPERFAQKKLERVTKAQRKRKVKDPEIFSEKQRRSYADYASCASERCRGMWCICIRFS